MMTIPRVDTGAFHELFTSAGPVSSVYFDVRATGEQEAHPRWRRIADTLTAAGADPATVKALADRILGAVPGPGVLAAFATGDVVACTAELADSDQPDLAVYGGLPHVVPLMAWLQGHPAHVVALVDRTGADLTVYPRGTTEPVSVVVEGPDDEIERNAPGGVSQGRFQRRAQDSWDHNAGRVAEAVASTLRRYHARLLLLGGDVRALQYLHEHLPARVHQDVAVRKVSGGRSQDGSWARRTEQIRDEVQQAVDEELAALLEQLAENQGPGGRAVTGRQQTVAALAAGRVQTLLLADGAVGRRTAWFGPGPRDVAADRRPLVRAGLPARRGTLEDVATRAAILTGAELRVLAADRAEDLVEGIGALCRFNP